MSKSLVYIYHHRTDFAVLEIKLGDETDRFRQITADKLYGHGFKDIKGHRWIICDLSAFESVNDELLEILREVQTDRIAKDLPVRFVTSIARDAFGSGIEGVSLFSSLEAAYHNENPQ